MAFWFSHPDLPEGCDVFGDVAMPHRLSTSWSCHGLRSGDWLGHVTLHMTFTNPLLGCPNGVFGIIVMLEDPTMFPHQSRDHPYPTRRDIEWSLRSRETVSDIVCIPCFLKWSLFTKLQVYVRRENNYAQIFISSHKYSVRPISGWGFQIKVKSNLIWLHLKQRLTIKKPFGHLGFFSFFLGGSITQNVSQ